MKCRIRELRQKSGLTMSELSRKSQISRATIWKLETEDDVITTTRTLSKIAEALSVPVAELFVDTSLAG